MNRSGKGYLTSRSQTGRGREQSRLTRRETKTDKLLDYTVSSRAFDWEYGFCLSSLSTALGWWCRRRKRDSRLWVIFAPWIISILALFLFFNRETLLQVRLQISFIVITDFSCREFICVPAWESLLSISEWQNILQFSLRHSAQHSKHPMILAQINIKQNSRQSAQWGQIKSVRHVTFLCYCYSVLSVHFKWGLNLKALEYRSNLDTTLIYLLVIIQKVLVGRWDGVISFSQLVSVFSFGFFL